MTAASVAGPAAAGLLLLLSIGGVAVPSLYADDDAATIIVSAVSRDVLSTAATAAAARMLVGGFAAAAERGRLGSRDSRKLVHALSGPLFILTWPMFSPAPGARFLCAVVPLLNAFRLWTASAPNDDAPRGASSPDVSLARALSRSGDVGEARGGPLIYTAMLFAFVVLFWRDSPVGVVSLATMAAGDGMADLVGRRFGRGNRWPGSDKSVAGTLAFWIAATVASAGLLAWMNLWRCWTIPVAMEWTDLVGRLALITMAAALLELVPIADDNYTVPISTAILTYLFFPK